MGQPIVSRPILSSYTLDYLSPALRPTALAWIRGKAVAIFTSTSPRRHPLAGYAFTILDFPPEWSHLAVIEHMVNAAGPFALSLTDPAARVWIESQGTALRRDPRPILKDLTATANRARLWFLLALTDQLGSVFSALRSKAPEVVRQMWDTAFGHDAAPLWIQRASHEPQKYFHPDSGWGEGQYFFPRPADAEWRLEPLEEKEQE
jgi:hypothetical protein